MMVHRRSLWCSIIFSFLGIITIIASVVITALLLNNVIVQHNNDGVVGAVIFCGLGCVLLVVGIIYGVVTYKKSKVKNPDPNPELRPEQLLVSACDSMDSPMDCNIVKTGFMESLPLECTETETHNTFIQNNSSEGPIDIKILDSKNLCNQIV